MASKRLREETPENEETLVNKKSKPSVTDILSLLEQEEDDDSTEDLSSLMKILEQELSTAAPESDADAAGDGPSLSPSSSADEEERERVMRHLLEASDDELGLPVVINEVSGSDGGSMSSGEYVSGDGGGEGGFDVCDGLMWQIEDDAANYYQLMQSGF